MPDQPKSIVYLRPDTIGDLVIFASALTELMRVWPEARHTIVVRPGYETLAPLFSPELEWRVAPLNPFRQKPSECREQLALFLQELETVQPDVVVAGTINRTWFEAAVAAHFPAARRVALGGRAVDPLFAAALQLELGVDAAEAFPEIVAVDESLRDWENNHRLADQLAGRPLPRSMPAVRVPAEAATAASHILQEHALSAQKWAAVFPAGLANVPIKAWPERRFAELILWLQHELKQSVLLLAHVSEATIIENVVSELIEIGGTKPAVWLGQDGEVPLLAALLEQAEYYVGHDTGAMHLAAAVGRPVVGIFGGGHWPRFRPVGHRVLSVVEPLPCFGCNWDCHFGNAPCVKTISLAGVQSGIKRVLESGTAAFDEVIEEQNLSAETLRFIAAETPRYRALQLDRIERQHRIEELKRETDLKDEEIGSLKEAANVKDAEIAALKKETDGKDAEIAELKTETDGKDAEIDALKREANTKDREIASLKEETNGKDSEIDALKRETNGKDGEISSLKQIANEREQLIFVQDAHIKNFQKTVAELTAIQAARDAEIAAMKPKVERVAHLEWLFSQLPEDADRIAHEFEAKNVHIQNLETHAANREQELAILRRALAEREQSLANLAAGLTALEGAKHYGRLLSEKEAVIQTLHKACTEREKVIRQLAVEATGLGSRLAKLATAVRQHWRLKIAVPLDDWLFKKVVENYWMQIGILQHYAPRPLAWDKFPKPRLPEERLPQIGLVTPSYQQETFIESTLLSVLNQKYPKLRYVVQDGGSTDRSPEIVSRYADRLAHWESARDKGQADAIRKGFSHLEGRLEPDDVMAWLNSDDLVAPRALRHVGEFFARNPDVDVVYGHRIIIDPDDREIGRWIMPRHDPRSLEWIDYVPQETLFWRKRAWDLVGGIDPSFQFALDWDLLARFTQAKLRIVRLPYFLGCFRVHPTQKTSAVIHTTGAEEMARVRTRFHGAENQGHMETINAWARRIRFQGALTARLHGWGIRW